MKTSLKLMAALAVLAGVAGTSYGAMQGGQQKEVTYFYEDETYTNMVGGTLVYCDGSSSRWGSYTLYSQYYYFGCH